MSDDFEVDAEDVFEDEETMEIFRAQLERNGLVASISDGGVLVGFSVEKLREFLDLAEKDEDKKVIILMKNGIGPQGDSGDEILN